jgi:hypothetical protein
MLVRNPKVGGKSFNKIVIHYLHEVFDYGLGGYLLVAMVIWIMWYVGI